MFQHVNILGEGIAACCCARLLSERNLNISIVPKATSSGPTLLINRGTEQLLKDVFGTDGALFSGVHAIRRRVVLWGNEEIVTFPHYGFVIPEALLLERLWSEVKPIAPSTGKADFTIYSAPESTTSLQHHFGSRVATAAKVHIRKTAADACWIESLADGWLFLLPFSENAGSLIEVGGHPADLLKSSRLVAPEVTSLLEASGQFSAHPRIVDPLCAPGWLACGSCAIGFDPICGAGAGTAVREAILASSVIGALAEEHDSKLVLAHYASRLLSGFVRHLETCSSFYAAADRSSWWRQELAELRHGAEWTRNKISDLPKPQYRLKGFSPRTCGLRSVATPAVALSP
jgi:hypothetical protein